MLLMMAACSHFAIYLKANSQLGGEEVPQCNLELKTQPNQMQKPTWILKQFYYLHLCDLGN